MFEAWKLRQDSVKAEEEKLREDVRSLNDVERAEYFRKYTKLLKDPDTYAVLNWFFLAGLHHFYLGKQVRGSINILIMLFGVILLFFQSLIGIVLLSGIILIEIPALFRSQTIVADHNTKLGRRILESGQVTISSRTEYGAVRRAP